MVYFAVLSCPASATEVVHINCAVSLAELDGSIYDGRLRLYIQLKI